MIDVTDQTIQQHVLEESTRRPVVVEMWSPRTGPDQPLSAILGQIIGRTAGAVQHARINVDENPQAAQAFRVQTIPSVFALVNGQIADAFDGPRSEAEILDFVARLLPSPDEQAIDQMIATGDEPGLVAILEQKPGNAKVVMALATIMVDDGRHNEALELLARIPETEEARTLAARARTGIADQEAATSDIEEKLEALLGRVKDDDEARQEFVDLLAVMGPNNPATAGWRKKLTTQLF